MKILRYITWSLIVFGVFPLTAGASRLYMLPTKTEVEVNQPFKVELRLDTQGEDVNALDIRVEIIDPELRLESSSDGSSLINIWLEKPHIKELLKCSSGKLPCKGVQMAGISPGGFVGDGLIAELTFAAKKYGHFSLRFAGDSVVLLNRQDAAPSFVISNGAKVVVRENNGEDKPKELDQFAVIDGVPPEQFQLQLGRDENAFDNKWFLSFSTQDKDSGVSHYEIRERLLGFWDGNWVRADSPYVLQNQHLFTAIYVRAIDNKGMVQEGLLVPAQLKALYGSIAGILFVILMLGGVRGIVRQLPKL